MIFLYGISEPNIAIAVYVAIVSVNSITLFIVLMPLDTNLLKLESCLSIKSRVLTTLLGKLSAIDLLLVIAFFMMVLL